MYYCYERGFTMSAMEVSIILILQDSYGWTESLSGMSFAIVGAGGIVMTGLSALLASFKWLTESKIFLSIMCLGACSSLLLFRFQLLGPFSLLFAARCPSSTLLPFFFWVPLLKPNSRKP